MQNFSATSRMAVYFLYGEGRIETQNAFDGQIAQIFTYKMYLVDVRHTRTSIMERTDSILLTTARASTHTRKHINDGMRISNSLMTSQDGKNYLLCVQLRQSTVVYSHNYNQSHDYTQRENKWMFFSMKSFYKIFLASEYGGFIFNAIMLVQGDSIIFLLCVPGWK